MSKPRNRFPIRSRDDIATHSQGRAYPSGCCGRYAPALNVKTHETYDWPGLIEKELGCPEAAAERGAELASQARAQQFWDDAQDCAREVWGESGGKPRATVYSAGRSGGWLYVWGIGAAVDMTAPELSKWRRFARMVSECMDWALDTEAMLEDVRANEWADIDAEQYNFRDGANGPATVASIKRARKAAADAAERAILAGD